MFKRSYKKWKNKLSTDTSENGLISFIPIRQDAGFLDPKKSVDMIPEWYKKTESLKKLTSKSTMEDLTIKRCIPVLDAYTTGYYLVTTTDYNFTYDKDKEESSFTGLIQLQDGGKTLSQHPFGQIDKIPISDDIIQTAFKWNNPFIIKTPPGYSCIFTHPLNQPYLPFISLSGVVDTDKYFQPVLFPFLMKSNFEGTIPSGTPIIQIIPFKRDDWKMEVLDRVPSKFLDHYHHKEMEYESTRYDKDGNVLGGEYKREYRQKKTYL